MRYVKQFRCFVCPLRTQPSTLLHSHVSNRCSGCWSKHPWAFFLFFSLWVCILLVTIEAYFPPDVSSFDLRLGASLPVGPRVLLLVPSPIEEQAAAIAPFGKLVRTYPSPLSLHPSTQLMFINSWDRGGLLTPSLCTSWARTIVTSSQDISLYPPTSPLGPCLF